MHNIWDIIKSIGTGAIVFGLVVLIGFAIFKISVACGVYQILCSTLRRRRTVPLVSYRVSPSRGDYVEMQTRQRPLL